MAGAGQTESGEDQLIARYFKPLVSDPGALGLADDAAVMTPPAGCDLVLTTDAIVAGIHFLGDDPAKSIARKAMRVNLSDIAAKGARPLGCLLTLALRDNVSEEWLAGFAEGLKADIAQYNCPLFGGDTVRTAGPIMISVTMFGSVPAGTMVKRSGARVGDKIFVTGTIGDAALGVKLATAKANWPLSNDQRAHLIARYRIPQPRVALAEALRQHASAAMDVSDGLVGDLAKLCRASGVAADIITDEVPLSEASLTAISVDPAALETVMTGGDDYEILGTIAPGQWDQFCEAAAQAQVAVQEIGMISAGQGVTIRDGNGKPVIFRQTSFSHF